MVGVVVVYWRDIPAQIIVGKGRKASKVQLTERFEQAIDRVAMKIGAEETDAYLAEWRKADAYFVDGEQDAVAQAEAAKGELEVFSKLCPTPLAAKRWAQVAQIISERLRHGRSVNIDLSLIHI